MRPKSLRTPWFTCSLSVLNDLVIKFKEFSNRSFFWVVFPLLNQNNIDSLFDHVECFNRFSYEIHSFWLGTLVHIRCISIFILFQQRFSHLQCSRQIESSAWQYNWVFDYFRTLWTRVVMNCDFYLTIWLSIYGLIVSISFG